MTTPVRFWRLYFRSVNTYNYGQLIFRTLKPHDANGNPLISGVTLSISAGLMNGTSFPLANLIEAWQEGIPLLKKGGKGTFFSPSALAYGPNGVSGIPGNSVLIFEIELVNF